MMAIESKFHRPPTVDRVLVSQGTRNDAKPATKIRFESYTEERDYYVAEKHRIQTELRNYSKPAIAVARQSVYKAYAGNRSGRHEAWNSARIALEADRISLSSELGDVEHELLRLRPLVKADKIRESNDTEWVKCYSSLEDMDLFVDGKLSRPGWQAHVLIELRAIRMLLEDKGRK